MFNGEPDRTCHLPDLRAAATENTQRLIDGFISANSYVSMDGAWVVNYAQWRNAEVFQAMLASAGPREHVAGCARLATAYDPTRTPSSRCTLPTFHGSGQ